MGDPKTPSRIFIGRYDGLGKQIKAKAVESIGRVANRSPFDSESWLIKPLRGVFTQVRNECPHSEDMTGGRYPTPRCGLTYAVGLREGIEKGQSETIVASACGIAGEHCLKLCEQLTSEVTTIVKVNGTKLT